MVLSWAPGRQQEAPVARHNFLMALIHFVEDKVRTVNRRCLICDGHVPFVGLKPSICDKDICGFQFEKMGLGVPLATQPRVRIVDSDGQPLGARTVVVFSSQVNLPFRHPVPSL